MKLYILHYAETDNEGRLAIHCENPYHSFNEAQGRQQILLEEWCSRWNRQDEMVYENIGNFKCVRLKTSFAEIQSCIEMYDI